MAQFARLLVCGGILQGRDMVRSAARLEGLCAAALTRWLNEQLAGLRILRPGFCAYLGSAPGYPEHAHRTGQAVVQIEWCAQTQPHLYVGAQIERLQQLHPGLGGSAMRWIARASWQSFPVFSFEDQLSVASFTMWGGEACLEDFIAAHELEAEEAQSVREARLDRQDILAQTPQWVFDFGERDCLPAEALWRIARTSRDRLAAAVAKALLALQAIESEPDYLSALQEDGGEFVGFAATVCWSEDDHTRFVQEVLQDYAMQGGDGFDVCGIHSQCLDDEDAFQAWLADMQALFVRTRGVDRLLALLCGAH